MTDRVALLAPLVAPRPVARPAAAAAAWPLPGWPAGAALAVLAVVALVLGWRRLRHLLAGWRLRRLAVRLRADAVPGDVGRLLPAVWRDLRRSGVDPTRLPEPARSLRDRLLYAPDAGPATLCVLLDALDR